MEKNIKKIGQNEITKALLEQDSRKIRLSTIKTEYKKIIKGIFIKLGREPEISRKENEKIN